MTRVLVLCAFGCAFVLAQEVHDADSDRGEMGFNEGSAHNDMTQDEAKHLVEKHFNECDTNGDGHIDFTELYNRFSTHMGLRYKKLDKDHAEITADTFKRADADGDGSLSAEEYHAQHGHADEMKSEFAFFDHNKDNQLDIYEYEAAQAPYKQSPARVLEYCLHKATEEMNHIKPGGKVTWADFAAYHKFDSQYHEKEGTMGGPVSQLKKKFHDQDADSSGFLDAAEYAKFHKKTHAPAADPIEDEVMYIMHELAHHKRDTVKEIADMRNEIATLADCTKHYQFFVNYNARVGKEEL
jgi:Ca2+-binding EF-hand superfamily protein